MLDYNERFAEWERKAVALGVRRQSDLTQTQLDEFEKLTFLSEKLMKTLYGNTAENMEGFLCMCLPREDYYNETGAPLSIVAMEQDKILESPRSGKRMEIPLYGEDERNRRFAVLYCDRKGPDKEDLCILYDALNKDLEEEGYLPEEFPEVFAIFITDADLFHNKRICTSLDFRENTDAPKVRNWHVVFVNADLNPYTIARR